MDRSWTRLSPARVPQIVSCTLCAQASLSRTLSSTFASGYASISSR